MDNSKYILKIYRLSSTGLIHPNATLSIVEVEAL